MDNKSKTGGTEMYDGGITTFSLPKLRPGTCFLRVILSMIENNNGGIQSERNLESTI